MVGRGAWGVLVDGLLAVSVASINAPILLILIEPDILLL